MVSEQPPLPITQASNAVVVGILRRAPDEEAIAHLLIECMLSPAVAILAERDFVPLLRLMIIARLGELLALPHRRDALFEDIAHTGRQKTVQAEIGRAHV